MRKYNLLALFILMQLGAGNSSLYAQSCPTGRVYCKNIKTCERALFYLEVCGIKKLDRDSDGVPCEAVCGRKLTPVLQMMKQKLQHQKPLSLTSDPTVEWRCGQKKSCREMTSCKEARFYFRKCGLSHMDGDKDGKPCNRLCR